MIKIFVGILRFCQHSPINKCVYQTYELCGGKKKEMCMYCGRPR